MKFLFLLLFSIVSVQIYATELIYNFSRGQWDQNDWFVVKSARWEHVGSWLQNDDHIRNHTPDIRDENAIKKSHRSYAAMLLKQKINIKKDCTISSEMSFDHRMAPIIVIAAEPGRSPGGIPEFREHWEVVLYDLGINVWHHTYKEGKPSHVRAAFLYTPFLKKVRYLLQLKVVNTRKGRMLEIECEGKKFGCFLPGFPCEFYTGIIGCEGINRFYNFKLSSR